MRSFVSEISTLFLAFSLLVSVANGQAKCSCRPSPPGGVTTCDNQEVAICGVNRDGICEGRCIRPRDLSKSATIPPPAVFLEDLLKETLGENEAKRVMDRNDPSELKGIVDLLIKSSEQDKTVKVVVDQEQYKIAVGIPKLYLGWLKEISLELDKLRKKR